MNFLDSVQGFVPPSTNIAVGPDFLVETINSQIQFYDKATGTALLPNTPLSTFFTQAGGEIPVQPVVTYDDIAGRFIVAAITLTPDFSSLTNHLLLAVSNDSNPLMASPRRITSSTSAKAASCPTSPRSAGTPTRW